MWYFFFDKPDAYLLQLNFVSSRLFFLGTKRPLQIVTEPLLLTNVFFTVHGCKRFLCPLKVSNRLQHAGLAAALGRVCRCVGLQDGVCPQDSTRIQDLLR